MKKILIYSILFVLPIVLLAYPLDYIISYSLKRSNNFAANEYPVWNDILESNIDHDVFIYGSSRAWRHIDSKMIADSLTTTAYNFGSDGHNFKMQYFRHQMLLKKHKPRVIIQSVDMFTLMKQSDLYNSEQFLPYLLDHPELKSHLLTYNGFRKVDFALPLFRYFGNYLAVKEALGQFSGLDANAIVRVNGFSASNEVWDGKFDRIKSKLKAIQVPIDAETRALFEQYLSNCKTQKIQVILVYTPEYIEGQKFETNRNEIIAMYRKLSVKYEMPFLDYSKDAVSYDKKYFYNALHMNKTGTDAFNAKFVADLQKLNLRLN